VYSPNFTPTRIEKPFVTEHALRSEFRNRRWTLVVAHPGHELRVHGWMEVARPVVCVLTDGSGHTGQSRLSSTSRLLTQASARPGPIYGRFTDIEFYAAILNRDFRLFIELAEELAETLVRDDIEYVAGDAIEGYNPAHDICRALIDTAVQLATRIKGRRIENFDFLPVGRPDPSSDELQSRAVWVHLDEAAFDRKLAAARSYTELSDEVNTMIDEMGPAAFQTELLRSVINVGSSNDFESATPFYEKYGENQVAAGVYRQVIRYHEHIFPISEALLNYAQS
jgi:hypothetical protein